jgi:hypothetical protein
MKKMIEVEVALTIEDTTVNRTIELEFKEAHDLLDLTDQQVFLVSESIRTALIHEKGLVHNMVRELAGKDPLPQ